MKNNLKLNIASAFTEFYARGTDLYPIHFSLPKDDKGIIIGRYINALDLVIILGYKNYLPAWNKLKTQYNLSIEYSLVFNTEAGSFAEEFLTFKQAQEIVYNSSRLRCSEKNSLLAFIVESIVC
ncbi:hypothetical protein AMR41_29425 [Hapalosiphon sp. MRB220]|nr:hypothetical protein AMR41_29425 [Hapalosiphon sp. MRB220]